MNTQTAMNAQDIQAKLAELKAKRVELESTLSKMSKDAALAMVAGEDMNKFEENRHRVAEEARHTGDLIAALEQSLLDAARDEDVLKLRKALNKLEATKPKSGEIVARRDEARRLLKEAETELAEIDEIRAGAHRLRQAYRDALKKKHKMTDIELNQIEAEYKL